MTKVSFRLLFVFALVFPFLAQAQQGPANVPRSLCDPSIHEGPSGRKSAGLRTVDPALGLLPASYDWFGGVLRALGSALQPLAGDPTYVGYKSGQLVGYDFRPVGFKQSVSRLFSGFKGIGGKNVTDTPSLVTPGSRIGGQCPGDPYWVGFPRPGNVENPPPFQFVHYNWDCWCRYDELVACPTGQPPPQGIPIFIPGPNLHRTRGGRAGFIPCNQCFGDHNIRKHDVYVGRNQGPHFGYPNSYLSDTGYQECLRQSITSGARSEPYPFPIGDDIYGL